MCCMQCLQMAKWLNSSCSRIGETILKQPLEKPSVNGCCALISEAVTSGVLYKKAFLKSLQSS